MANKCSFEMALCGKENDVVTFIDIISLNGDIFMGRGAMVDIADISEAENGKIQCLLKGNTDWSVEAALIGNAISARTEPDEWLFGEEEEQEISYITLPEACKKLNLEMECYSREEFDGFEEHFLYKNGEFLSECRTLHYVCGTDETDGYVSGSFNRIPAV